MLPTQLEGMPPPPPQAWPQGQAGAGEGEGRLGVVVERMSEQLRAARQQGGDVLSLLDHLRAWRRAAGPATGP